MTRIVMVILAALAAGPAWAEAAAPAAALSLRWGFNPLVLLPLAGVAYLYMTGVERLALRARPVAAWRQALFYAGIVAIYAALQSPIDALARQLYTGHAAQAILLRIAGPLLMFMAAPQSALIAGLGPRWRRRVARALPHQGAVKRGVRAWARPLPAGAVFLVLLYVWELPPLMNASVRLWGVGALMNLCYLASGLVFFAVLLDPRDPPVAARHGHRQMMLFATIAAQLVLGAALTLKPMVLYTAYGLTRPGGMTALADEGTGGFIHWTPASLMLLACIITVVHHWNGAEERRWARAQGGRLSNSEMMALMPQTAEELWMVVRPKNRRTALGLSMVPLIVYCLVFAVVFTVRAVG